MVREGGGMNIYLVQHGKSVSKEQDPERPVSAQGRLDVERLAAFLKKAGVRLESVFHSKKLRARQTAEVLASRLNPVKGIQEREDLSPLDDVREITAEITKTKEDLMIVGHLPHLAKLTSFLTTGRETDRVAALQQGGVVCLRPDEEKSGWAIAWMMVPEIMPGLMDST
jgi:phosphohistidine phosphatase